MGSEKSIGRKGKVLRAVFIALALIGVGLALELTRIYVKVRLDPDFQSACAVNDKVNCLTVAQNNYSAFWGIPVSIWGLGAYLSMAVIAGLSFSSRELSRSAAVILNLGLTAFGLLTSVLLFYISEFVIKVVCPYCMGTYLVNAAMFLIWLGLYWSEGGSSLWKRVFDALKSELGPLVKAGGLAPSLALLIMALFAGGYKLAYGDLNSPMAAEDRARLQKLSGPGGLAVGFTEDGHPWIGAENPELTITEFSDYQCPFCQPAHAQIREILLKYQDRVRLIHRQLPLDTNCNPLLSNQMHECACQFSRYAICASEQGAVEFWEMNDYLFKLDPRLGCVDRVTAANAVSIDRRAFYLCLDSGRADQEIRNEIVASHELGVTGTPSYLFSDGFVKVGAVSEQIVLDHLPKPETPPPQPTTWP